MIKKILIANRGEIACRVIKTARRLGIATVAVYSQADSKALHVALADEALCVGNAPSKESYLVADRILDAAKKAGADAVHPGYGFLSENAGFANALADNDLIFIGPPSAAIEAMGSKSAAKHIMEQAGVPLVPGYHGNDQRESHLHAEAEKMGYPVLLKAAAGGGGKGMRVVWNSEEFSHALAAAKREAMASFSDDIMLVEKYLTQPRHVEIQVFCDAHGNGVYLFERDCSVQRRHQKVIEEAPAPGMSEVLRKTMGDAALKAAHAIGYVGAGTVEFLLDSDGRFYFMEMNTRLQVEHPVTEMITGEDLVEWQIRVAEGAKLPKRQSELTLNGHAFEARVYAEDPDNHFLPATGTLTLLQPPNESDHIRVDTGVLEGDTVSVYYDPMIAKLIVWGENRDLALQRLLNALREYYIDGVTTNIDFLYNVAASEPFRNAELVTTFIEQHQNSLFPAQITLDLEWLPVMGLLLLLNKTPVKRNDNSATSPWALNNAWRPNYAHSFSLRLVHKDNEYELLATARNNGWDVQYQDTLWHVSGEIIDHRLMTTIDGHKKRYAWCQTNQRLTLFSASETVQFAEVQPDLGHLESDISDANFVAPMNGTIVSVLAKSNQNVAKGDVLIVMEAMKMEHNITAPNDGCVVSVFYQAGEMVDGGATLLEFETNE